jgi:hypothetical protein
MIYDWRKIEDLTKASIFDLTDDIELIRECICLPSFEMEDRQKYIDKMTENTRVSDFEAFALETHDEEFVGQLKIVFKDYYEKLNDLPEGVYLE